MTGFENQNKLKRVLGIFPLTNIVIANMIGAGIFTTSGLLMQELPNPLLMLGLWVLGGVIALCGAMSYGALGAAIPLAGGEYIYLARLYHPALGFLSGWVSFFVGFSAPIAASALAFVEYIVRVFPGLSNSESPVISIESIYIKKLLAITIILIFTLIHLRGIRLGIRVQNTLTIIKILLIVALILAGFTFGSGDRQHFSSAMLTNKSTVNWRAIGLALLWIMFAYSGWNASAYIGSEVKNPRRNIPASLVLGAGVVMLLYLILNLLYVYAASPSDMAGVVAIAGLAMEKLFGKSFESVASLLIAFALFSSLSAYIILGPRVYYAMARDGIFFKFASWVHPRFAVPSRSILFQGGIAAFMVAVGTFDQLLTYMGFCLGIFPILTVMGVFRIKRPGRGSLWGYPWVPLFYMLMGVLMLILSFIERPVESIIAIFTVLIGVPIYFLLRK